MSKTNKYHLQQKSLTNDIIGYRDLYIYTVSQLFLCFHKADIVINQ